MDHERDHCHYQSESYSLRFSMFSIARKYSHVVDERIRLDLKLVVFRS